MMERLAAIPDTQSMGDEVRACLVSSLGKLGAQAGQDRLPDAADELLHLSAASHNIDLQQRALEALALLRWACASDRASCSMGSAHAPHSLYTCSSAGQHELHQT